MRGPLAMSVQPPDLRMVAARDALDDILTAPGFLSLEVDADAPGLGAMRRVEDVAQAARMASIDPAQASAPVEEGLQCLPHVVAAAMQRGKSWSDDPLPDGDAAEAAMARCAATAAVALMAHVAGRLRRSAAVAVGTEQDVFLDEITAQLGFMLRHIFVPAPRNGRLFEAFTAIYAAGGIPCGWFGPDPDEDIGNPVSDLAYLAVS
ncbi:hypothetical protein [uncultured Jannaschia sp.]|uniref:hypothetical protein n=1 Tax=uncultured Jannaschia sp. TaxID=293347 RepID=UPI00262E1D7C|nr:hypothetical protein [uncultured Jannaschia sp.]